MLETCIHIQAHHINNQISEHMKKLLFISLLLFCQLSATAQDADKTAGQLVNGQNWLELNIQYPQLKTQMKSEMLKNIAEAMIGYQFNRPEHFAQ